MGTDANYMVWFESPHIWTEDPATVVAALVEEANDRLENLLGDAWSEHSSLFAAAELGPLNESRTPGPVWFTDTAQAFSVASGSRYVVVGDSGSHNTLPVAREIEALLWAVPDRHRNRSLRIFYGTDYDVDPGSDRPEDDPADPRSPWVEITPEMAEQMAEAADEYEAVREG